MEINFPKKNEILAWLQKSNMELDSQELDFLDDLNLIDINPDELIKARSERNEFSTDLMQCHSPKQLEKIASKWDDSFLSTKLNWLSKIIFYSICKKLNDTDILISSLKFGSTQCQSHAGNITILPSNGSTLTSLHRCEGGSPFFLLGITICAADLGSLNTICPEFLGALI